MHGLHVATHPDATRPIKDFGRSWCMPCGKATTHQLNSDGESYEPDYQCQECGRHINMLYGC